MALTIAPVQGQILKRDSAGWVKTPRELRQAILEKFDRSGMSGQKFAKWAEIKYTTFANWLQQRCKEAAGEKRRLGRVCGRLSPMHRPPFPFAANGR